MIAILITLDCVRKDHFNKDLAPKFFASQNDWVCFENAFSQSQNTLSSHFTMLTSKYLFQHGVYSNFSDIPLPEYSIDKLLRKKGYETKGVCGISFLANQLGNKIGEKDKLFDVSDSKIKKLFKKILGERRKANKVLSNGLKWLLDDRKKTDKFLWMHLFDAHMPYYCPSKYFQAKKINSEKSVKEQIDERGWFSPYFKEYEQKVDLSFFPESYKGAIRYIDDQLNIFFNLLKSVSIFDESLIFLTADHGECLLGDHDIYCAHKKLFDETVNVPFFVKFPKNKYGGEKVFEIVEHTDIAPTIGRFANVEEENYEGFDLFKMVEGKTKNRDFSLSEHVDNFMKGIRDKDFLYVEKNDFVQNKWGMKLESDSLFNRDGEPFSDKNKEKEMKEKMENFLKNRNYEEKTASKNGRSTEEIEKQLKSLGYL